MQETRKLQSNALQQPANPPTLAIHHLPSYSNLGTLRWK
jgi:hypothetical protein